MNSEYASVANKSGHRCDYCRAPESLFCIPFAVEYIIPVLRGGTKEEENFALCCRFCLMHKLNYVTGHDPLGSHNIRLFHPRRSRWAEHFSVNADTGVLLGQSSTGRATIIRLHLNDGAQIKARLQWKRLELFP